MVSRLVILLYILIESFDHFSLLFVVWVLPLVRAVTFVIAGSASCHTWT